ncbi:MAG: hypothetical protein N2440_06085 [Actinobacteria bacterium]|nr:hypothetical protein [Actinomycetota bacterium]
MLDYLWNKRIAIISFLFLLIAILLLVMPPEAKLGNKVRLVYFHASIAENSIIFFVMAGIASLIFLFSKGENLFLRAISLFSVGFYLWVFQTILGAVNMKVIWGNFFWSEPKAKMGLILLAFSLVLFVLNEARIFSKKVLSFLFIAMALLAIFGLLFVSNVFHPSNAIFGSDVLAYKIIFVVLVISWFIINLLWSEKIFRSMQVTKKTDKK